MSKNIRLYGGAISTCSRRVLATLVELDLPYEIVHIDLLKREQKQPAHLKRQPFGLIPVLEDVDGTEVFESRAIIRYLVHAYPKQGEKLVPQANKDFARVEAWLEAEAQNFHPPIAALVSELFFNPFFTKAAPNTEVVAKEKAKLEAVLDVMEKHLADTKLQYLAGDTFTVADISYLPYTEYLVNNTDQGGLITSRPHVAAWWKRISERPAWQNVRKGGF